MAEENPMMVAWKGKTFQSENDLRSWVRWASFGKARWVEPSIGSTTGLPDFWVPFGGFGLSTHIELKFGEIHKGSMLKYNIRTSQIREINKMLADGISVGLMVGIKDSKEIIILPPTEEALSGYVDMSDLHGNKKRLVDGSLRKSFWFGISFVFRTAEEFYSGKLPPKIPNLPNLK